MKTVYLVKGFDPVEYLEDVLAVFGREDSAYEFMERYAAEASAKYDPCADKNEFYNYYTYEVQSMEVQ